MLCDVEKVLCNKLKTNSFSKQVELSTGFVSKCYELVAFVKFGNDSETHNFFSSAMLSPKMKSQHTFHFGNSMCVLEECLCICIIRGFCI